MCRQLSSANNVFVVLFEFCHVRVQGLPAMILAFLGFSVSKAPEGCRAFTVDAGVKLPMRSKIESDTLGFIAVRIEEEGCEAAGEICTGGIGLPFSIGPSCFSTGRPLADICDARCFAIAAVSSICDCLCPPRSFRNISFKMSSASVSMAVISQCSLLVGPLPTERSHTTAICLPNC